MTSPDVTLVKVCGDTCYLVGQITTQQNFTTALINLHSKGITYLKIHKDISHAGGIVVLSTFALQPLFDTRKSVNCYRKKVIPHIYMTWRMILLHLS